MIYKIMCKSFHIFHIGIFHLNLKNSANFDYTDFFIYSMRILFLRVFHDEFLWNFIRRICYVYVSFLNKYHWLRV